MKNPKYFLLPAFVLVMITSSCVKDRKESSYATVDELHQADPTERGWVPECLPDKVFNIREIHDLDTNELWGVFNFPPDDLNWRTRCLLQAPQMEKEQTRLRDPGRTWWPQDLTGEVGATALTKQGLSLYSEAKSESVIAIDWEKGRAFFWHSAR